MLIQDGSWHNKRFFTDVTMTAPLAFTHKKITCVGVMPRRLAAFSTGTSTGPPGKAVIDLKISIEMVVVN
jgi:hypothetical protein